MKTKKILRGISLTILIIITVLLLIVVTFNLSAQEVTIKQYGNELYVKIDCRNLPEIFLDLRIWINNKCVYGETYLNDQYGAVAEFQRSFSEKGKVTVILYTDGKNKVVARKTGFYE